MRINQSNSLIMQHSRVRLKVADRNSEQYLHKDVPADEAGDQCLGKGHLCSGCVFSFFF